MASNRPDESTDVYTLSVPRAFVWGAATSAFQIEGASRSDGKGPSIWDTFCAEPGRVRDGHTGDVAIDHYHRSRDDVALLANLSLDAYRFSISWPRVLPAGRGQVNTAGLGFYDRLVDELLDAGLAPYPTLYHWDLPQALQDAGGWPARDCASWFADYAAVVVGALGDRVPRWATLNEPWCAAYLGYASGIHAPGRRDAAASVACAHHLLLAHGRAAQAMRGQRPAIEVGIVLNPAPVSGRDGVSADTVRRVDGLLNRWFLDALLGGAYPEDVLADVGAAADGLIADDDLQVISAPLDWLGVNYYNDITLGPGERPGVPSPYPYAPPAHVVADTDLVTDLGWPVTPHGLTDLLVHLRDTYPNLPPLAITENGAAFDDPIVDGHIQDDRRIRYLAAHLDSLEQAIAKGVDVFGYFVWSAFDNFEWHDGYTARFGVIHVDYDTMVRTPRASALWLRDLVRRTRDRSS
jgi:beta-glucosidase